MGRKGFNKPRLFLSRLAGKSVSLPLDFGQGMAESLAVTRPDIQLLHEGDETAWNAVFDWLWPVALHRARMNVGKYAPLEVEDVAADAMNKLVEQVGSAETTEDLAPILISITYRKSMSRLRHVMAQRRNISHTVSLEHTGDLEDAATETPYGQLAETELTESLKSLFSILPPQHAAMIYEFYFRGVSYKELAEQHDLPMGTVSSIMRRSLMRLRKNIHGNEKIMKHFRLALRDT